MTFHFKEKRWILFCFLLICLGAVTVPADEPCGNVAEIPLLAGQTIDAGFVSVSNDQNSLFVVYHAENGWTITETHLAVATSLAGIPQTKKGSPIQGQFPYATSHNPGVAEVTHVVDLTSWPAGTTLYIAAHAVVVSGGSNETAWGDGLDFPGSNWATYFTYEVQPCESHPGVLQFGEAAYLVDENGITAFIEITRTDGSDGEVSVDFNTFDGTATAGLDYTAVGTTVVFAPGETGKTVEIPVLDDALVEGNEALDLVLSNVVGATLGDQNSAVLTIQDNDVFLPGVLQFGQAVYIVDESGVTAVIEITRTDGSDGEVSVDFNTFDDTATAGLDYTAVGTTVVFAPGETGKTVEIPVLDDALVEGNEALDLVLSNVVGAVLGDQNSAVLTIQDNDTLPPAPGILQFSDAQYSFNETDADQTIYITVIRTDGSDGEVSVDYTITEDTAWETIDYDGDFSGMLVFADGETEKTIALTLIGDNLKETDETFSVALSNVIGAVLGDPHEATALIKDDDGSIPE